MKVEIITFDADPNHGGFGMRVHSLVRMFARFAEVRVVLTDWFEEPAISGVTYERVPVRDNLLSKVLRLRTYYKTDFPRRRKRDVPDLAVVESLDLLGLCQYETRVPLVLDEHNVYWELLRYEITRSPLFNTRMGRIGWIRSWLVPRLMKRAKGFELDAVRRATRTLVSSESDRKLLLSELPHLSDRICVLPNCVDLNRFPSRSTPGTKDVVFVGNFSYGPNREAAIGISRDIAPSILEARFLLVGANPPEEARGTNVEAMGFVANLQPILEGAAVCIAPLSHGSGTRLKILTYLAAGKAVVASSKACEGLDVQDGVHLLIRNDAIGFQEAIRELLQDRKYRIGLATAGRHLVEQRYDWRVYADWLAGFVAEVLAEERSRPVLFKA